MRVDAEISAASDPQGRADGEALRGGDSSRSTPLNRSTTRGRGPNHSEEAQRSQRAYVRGSSLTIREQEILGLMAAGKSNREIALQVGVSDKTIKRHASNIFNKLAANTRAMAVRRALESGIL